MQVVASVQGQDAEGHGWAKADFISQGRGTLLTSQPAEEAVLAHGPAPGPGRNILGLWCSLTGSESHGASMAVLIRAFWKGLFDVEHKLPQPQPHPTTLRLRAGHHRE